MEQWSTQRRPPKQMVGDRKLRIMPPPSAQGMRPLITSWGALLLMAAILTQAAANTAPSTRNVFRARPCRALFGVQGGASEPPVNDAVLAAKDGTNPSEKKSRKVKKKVKRKRAEIVENDKASTTPLEAVEIPPDSKASDGPTGTGTIKASTTPLSNPTATPLPMESPKSKAKAKAKTTAKKKVKGKKRPATGGRESACLRRIKREWKDAVEMGVAYDWGKGETVARKKKSKSEANGVDPKRYNYVRMGPMGKNLLHWHFSVQGAPNSVYEKGVYHGRIILPRDYPLSPPHVQMLTPSGRFIPGHDICLSASSYHPESWTPKWTILSLIDALRLHMLTSANEIGGQHASDEQRRKRALESRSWGRGVVCHEDMLNEGIFALESEEDADDNKVDDETAAEQPTALSSSSLTEEEILLGMVTEEAIRQHGERTKKVSTKRQSTPVLIGKVIFYSVYYLLYGVVSVLKSPIKLAFMAFMFIFAYLNTRN